MNKEETNLMRKIQLELSQGDTRLFRNTVGFAWVGSTFRVVKGRLVEGSARGVSFGLGPGSSDLVGAHSILVRQDMVGSRIALSTLIEVKDGTRLTKEQRTFLEVHARLGALTGVATSVEEAREIITRLDQK